MSLRHIATPKSLFPAAQRLVRASLCLALALTGLTAAPAAGGPIVPGRASTITAEQAIAVALLGEVGDNDFRISHMGGDTLYIASEAAVAYNSVNHEYLVVWWGEDNTGALVAGEREIFGQRVDGATGAEIGFDFRISDMGPDGDTNHSASAPAVAYNSQGNEYLVVWYGDDNTGALVEGEDEIFGQRVNGATGAEIGADFRISNMGPDGDVDYYADVPAVTYSSADNEYLVVWQGIDDTGGMVAGENEIFGQRINAATGAEIGGDFRISDMGPVGDPDYGAANPALAYNSAGNEYLVVWDGDDNIGGLVDEEYEIFGQRLTSQLRLFLPYLRR